MDFYWPQRSWAKVMFLQVCVILFTGGGLPQCMLGYPPPPGGRPPWEQAPPPGADPPRADTPPGSRLQHTVNERPVRILLECILVVTARKCSLRKLCFYTCLSFILFTGGVLNPGWGFSIWGGSPSRGGSLSQGGFSIGGRGVLHRGEGGSPSGQCAGGTHPTGMHSCVDNFLKFTVDLKYT